MSTKKLRVCGYARVSTQDQARGLSIDVQTEQIKEYAEGQPGWNLTQIFTEPGASGGDFERPAFKKLQKKIEAGEVDVIVITKLDRLVRSLLHLLRFIENELEPRGVKFVSISEGIDSSQKGMSRVFMQVLSAFSEMERSRILERCGEGRQKNASLGRLNGPAPYGYKKSGDKLVTVPEEVRVIKRLFAMFNKGDRGALSIADEFALEHIVNRKGKPFTHSSLLTMLKNEFYTGRFVWGKNPRSGAADAGQYVVIENNHPAIISAADFERTRFILEHRISGFPTRERGEFVLAGLLFDHHGHRMKGINKKLKDKSTGYYGCSVYYGTGPGTGIRYCRQRRVASEELEKMVLDKAKEHIRLIFKQLEDGVTEQLFSDGKLQEMEAALKLELQDTQARAARLFEGFIDGAVSKKKFEAANHLLAADEEYIKGKISELESAKRRQLSLQYMENVPMTELLDSFEYFSDMPFFTKKKLLHQMIEKIVTNSRKGMPVQIEQIVWRAGFESV
ncbi:MAG: recombinase family protein [Victivallales bacterium]